MQWAINNSVETHSISYHITLNEERVNSKVRIMKATFVGLDLGSFQTSAVSSNGQRYSIPSAVAWPSDVFWDDVADGICQFGDHLNEANPELDVVCPLQKATFKFLDPAETGFNLDRADQAQHSLKLLARHAVLEVSPMSSQPMYGIVGCPARASDANRRKLLNCLQDFFTGLMVVPEAVLVAFALDRTQDSLVIDIGAGSTDISPIVNGELQTQDSITLPMGGDWIEDALAHEIALQHKGLPVPRNTLREIKEVFGTLFNDQTPATVTVLDDDAQHDLNVRSALASACRILGPSISNAVHEVLSCFDAQTAERLIQNTILTGATVGLEGVTELVSQSLSSFGAANVTSVDDTQFVCAVGACRMAESLQQQDWLKLSQLNTREEMLRAA